MKITPIVSVAFAFLLLALGCDSAITAKVAEAKAAETRVIDGKLFEGVWKPVNAALGGVTLSDTALAGITLKITGDEYKMTAGGKHESDAGTSILDPSTKPKRMILKGTNGPNKGKNVLAIFDFLDTNTLRICYDVSAITYPEGFKSNTDTQLYLVLYERQ